MDDKGIMAFHFDRIIRSICDSSHHINILIRVQVLKCSLKKGIWKYAQVILINFDVMGHMCYGDSWSLSELTGSGFVHVLIASASRKLTGSWVCTNPESIDILMVLHFTSITTSSDSLYRWTCDLLQAFNKLPQKINLSFISSPTFIQKIHHHVKTVNLAKHL